MLSLPCRHVCVCHGKAVDPKASSSVWLDNSSYCRAVSGGDMEELCTRHQQACSDSVLPALPGCSTGSGPADAVC